jgi:uncharacterized cupredoxin-like copper-binding protein
LIHINAGARGWSSIAELGLLTALSCGPQKRRKATKMTSEAWTGRCSALAAVLALGLVAVPVLPAAADTAVKIDMWDKPDGSQGMDLSTAKVKAGKVTFNVTNVSKNEEEHEFLVARTDLAPGQLPMTQAGARVDESKLTDLKELGDLEPGVSRSLTLNLTPGKYLLFCNEEGHFTAGMYAYLTVEP